jgi:hypothetical protein
MIFNDLVKKKPNILKPVIGAKIHVFFIYTTKRGAVFYLLIGFRTDPLESNKCY